MNLVDRFVIRRELATHRKWLRNIHRDWDLQRTDEDREDLARRCVDRLHGIDILEKRLRFHQ